ncbi:hypothetical protein yc1106_06612 [Curvularia clavata]|uniref:Major facilitator superfamily (MFS) profile domain-containing protein n=1 Tax=Curvularia clavata TaxID=95742 RepID=A0A9Q8ZFN7_CURCL|nr:hypothetical protein yc1106_06612 [Curvularia clavata]
MATALGDPTVSQWFGTIKNILTLVTILPVAQGADFWGRKWFILICNSLGVIGYLIVSRSNNITTVIVGFIIGSAAFGCQSLAYAIPSEVLPRKYRGYGQAAANISGGIGATVAVLMGTALTKHNPDGWRTYWYIGVGVYFLSIVCVQFGYNPPPRELETTMTATQKIRTMDWIGGFLIGISLVLVCMALQWAGNPYQWSNTHVLAPLIIGICFLFAFGLWEWKGTSEGILNHRLFHHRNLPLSLLLFFTEGLTFQTVNNYFVFNITTISHIDTWRGGLRFIVVFITSVVIAFVAGAYITVRKRVRETLVCGFLFVTTFSILMAFYRESLPLANGFGYAVLSGTGLGVILTGTIVAAQMGTPPDMISLGTALPLATRSLGGAVGLAIDNAIYSNTLDENLSKKIAEAVLPLGFNASNLGALIKALVSNSPTVNQISGITPRILAAAQHGLTEAYRLSFKSLWTSAACFAAAGVIGSIFILETQSEFTESIDAPVETKLLGKEEKF